MLENSIKIIILLLFCCITEYLSSKEHKTWPWRIFTIVFFIASIMHLIALLQVSNKPKEPIEEVQCLWNIFNLIIMCGFLVAIGQLISKN